MRNQVFAIHVIAAAGSVTLGTALTYPLDTAKVILQVGYLNFVIRLACFADHLFAQKRTMELSVSNLTCEFKC